MQPLNNLTSEISTPNGSSINTNDLLDSLSLGKLKTIIVYKYFFKTKY